mmetsp:Transcript_61502/g.159695  ORF Transcript_61502/g.159695 Transcript_61502/m.159695 type:complete len:219 (+) Transcript_61502:95-751(+)
MQRTASCTAIAWGGGRAPPLPLSPLPRREIKASRQVMPRQLWHLAQLQHVTMQLSLPLPPSEATLRLPRRTPAARTEAPRSLADAGLRSCRKDILRRTLSSGLSRRMSPLPSTRPSSAFSCLHPKKLRVVISAAMSVRPVRVLAPKRLTRRRRNQRRSRRCGGGGAPSQSCSGGRPKQTKTGLRRRTWRTWTSCGNCWPRATTVLPAGSSIVSASDLC